MREAGRGELVIAEKPVTAAREDERETRRLACNCVTRCSNMMRSCTEKVRYRFAANQ